MANTRHIQKRMSQRSITNEMLGVVQQFGVVDGDKILINRKGIDKSLRQLETIKKHLINARSRGGFVLVKVDNTLITTYSLDSYKRMKASDDPIY